MKLISALICVLLCAGVHGTVTISLDSGEEHTFTVLAFPSSIATCYLTTPGGTTFDFTPGETSIHGERYELLPITSMTACSITVKNLQESDSGSWEVSFVSPTGSGSSQRIDLTVTGTEVQQTENDDENIDWLSAIEHPTRIGQIIDISLPKIDREEKCTIRSPDGDSLRASELNIDGVVVRASSKFVSCRITVGPMVETLLGDWTVCGEYTDDGEEHKRCQPVKIYWNNANRPETIWDTLNQPLFEHPVHISKTLAPTVTGQGEVVACHIVTPNDEDLVITQDSHYPYVTAQNIAHSICNIAIGPIDDDFIGDWAIYGIFRSAVTGLNEVRLPFNMFLYDQENPHQQAYNVTDLGSVNRVVNIGNTLYAEVTVIAGQVDACQFQTPPGESYTVENQHGFTGASLVNDEESGIACQLAIGPITEALLGDWKLIGKFSNNGVFTELHQIFNLIQEDPENPIDEDRDIHFFNPQVIDAEFGKSYRLVIQSSDFIHGDSCHIRTPDGLQYTMMEGFSYEGVEFIEESGVECGVVVNVVSEDVIGEWTLIARSTRFSEAIERRLPFTIYVEESVEALENVISLTEGKDLYVRLRNPTDLYETCKLIGPYGFECPTAERDPHHVETCGFVRKNVQTFNSGTWTIVYGNRTVYKAKIVVTVSAGNIDSGDFMTTLDLIRDRSVEQLVGPVNAVYCRLEDPQGFAVFDDFGRCNLSLDSIGLEHHGVWKMFVGLPGKVLTEDYHLFVTVKESESRPVVTTRVEKQQPDVIISCAVQTAAEVVSCKFRDAQGRILLAANGVSEDRYVFHGSEVSYESEMKTHECGLRITNPLVSDLGMWRCAIQTTDDTHYGHMAVLCPWTLQDPAVAATVQQVPILRADRSLVSVVQHQPATLSCSVEAPIRYCYFRTSNGTTFTATPGMNTPSMQYVGAGFEAGECGFRFPDAAPTDSGRWSCHVGLFQDHEEQREQLQLTVHELMRVDHTVGHGNVMTVEGIVHEGRALDYCRFVRIDGFGFTTDSVPSEYTITGLLPNGECQFTARNPTILDLHPWTVVAKIRGQTTEIARDTMHAIVLFPPTEPEGTPDTPGHENVAVSSQRGVQIFFYTFTSVLLLAALLGVWLGPKKHRQWTSQRASAFRASFTSSFRKQHHPAQTPHV